MTERKIAQKAEVSGLKQQIEAQLTPKDGRLWWLGGLVGGSLLFLACAWLAHRHQLTGVNLALFRHINNWPNTLRLVGLAITIAPSSLIIGAASVVVTFVAKLYQLSWQLAAAVFVAGGAGMVAKKLIDEPRPFGMVPDVHIRAHETDPGFPSGHALMVTVIVLTLWPYLPRGWRWAALVCIPLMALSRIYLGVHSPLDVTGAVALGLAIVSAMRVLPEPIRKLVRFD